MDFHRLGGKSPEKHHQCQLLANWSIRTKFDPNHEVFYQVSVCDNVVRLQITIQFSGLREFNTDTCICCGSYHRKQSCYCLHNTWYIYIFQVPRRKQLIYVKLWCHVTLFNKAGVWKIPWWRHQMEIFSALLAICAGNSPITGEFPAQRPVSRSFDVLFDLRLNKRLSKQPCGWWFATPSHPLWRHCSELTVNMGPTT